MKRIIHFLAVAVLIPAGIGAQEAEREQQPAPKPGMVLVAGEWQAPTPDAALRALMDTMADPVARIAPTTAVLRQVYDSYSPGELGSLEGRLVDLIINGDEARQEAARLALVVAAASEYDDPGVPYAGSRAAFIRVFETLRTHDL